MSSVLLEIYPGPHGWNCWPIPNYTIVLLYLWRLLYAENQKINRTQSLSSRNWRDSRINMHNVLLGPGRRLCRGYEA